MIFYLCEAFIPWESFILQDGLSENSLFCGLLAVCPKYPNLCSTECCFLQCSYVLGDERGLWLNEFGKQVP
jgi:hypothetical protein